MLAQHVFSLSTSNVLGRVLGQKAHAVSGLSTQEVRSGISDVGLRTLAVELPSWNC